MASSMATESFGSQGIRRTGVGKRTNCVKAAFLSHALQSNFSRSLAMQRRSRVVFFRDGPLSLRICVIFIGLAISSVEWATSCIADLHHFLLDEAEK